VRLYEEVNDNHYVLPFAAVIVYLLMVFVFIPKFRQIAPPPSWIRHAFAAWNFFLSYFSTVGILICGLYVYLMLEKHGLRWMLCNDAMMLGPWDDPDVSCFGVVGTMMSLFMLSKFPELFDTFFLVYMGKPVPFLHWYHHATVLLYCWFAYQSATPSAVIFGTMNYLVHSIMYFYFGVSVYTKRLGFMRMPITMLQTSQMAMGIYLTYKAYQFTHDRTKSPDGAAPGATEVPCAPEEGTDGFYHGDCGCSKTYTESGYFYYSALLYVGYFLLFAKLFYDNYIGGGKKKAGGKSKAAAKPEEAKKDQ